MATHLQQTVLDWKNYLAGRFPERNEAVTAALVSYLHPSNSLFVSGPGMAKTALSRATNKVFGGSKFFFRQLNPQMVPEQLVGPISMKGLQNDVFEHKITSYLPEADGCILDETFRGDSVFDFLLLLLQEREFQQGSQTLKMPLISVIGATNSVPDEDSPYLALYDRFLCKSSMNYIVDEDNWKSMLGWSAAPVPPSPPQIPLQELKGTIHPQIINMKISGAAQDALAEVRLRLRNEGIVVSDRTWAQTCAYTDPFGDVCSSVVKAIAWMNGKTEVEAEDLAEALYMTLWPWPKDIPTTNKIVSQVCAPLDEVAQKLLNQAAERYAELKVLPGFKPNATAEQKAEAEGQLLNIFQAIKPVRAQIQGHLKNRDPNSPTHRKMREADSAVGTMLKELASKLDLGLAQ